MSCSRIKPDTSKLQTSKLLIQSLTDLTNARLIHFTPITEGFKVRFSHRYDNNEHYHRVIIYQLALK